MQYAICHECHETVENKLEAPLSSSAPESMLKEQFLNPPLPGKLGSKCIPQNLNLKTHPRYPHTEDQK